MYVLIDNYKNKRINKFAEAMPFAKFDYSLDYKNLDLKKHPELYRTGLGEQGVLMVEPYKSEILPHWKFKTPELAKQSAKRNL